MVLLTFPDTALKEKIKKKQFFIGKITKNNINIGENLLYNEFSLGKWTYRKEKLDK